MSSPGANAESAEPPRLIIAAPESAPARPPELEGPREPVRAFSLRHAATTYGTNLLVALLQLGNVLIMSRTLGPTGRGEVAFLTTVAGICAQLAIFGAHRGLANIAPRNLRVAPALATNSLVLSVVLGALALGILGALIAVFPAVGAHEPAFRLWLALASVPVLVLQGCLVQLVRSFDAHDAANLSWLIGPVITAAGNAALAIAGSLTATAAVAMWVGGQTLGTLVLVHATLRRAGFGRPNRRLAREMLGFGVKTHPSQVMLLTNYRLDQWLLGAISGASQLGIYSVAVAWSESLFFLPQALQAVQRPDLVRGTPEAVAWRASRVLRTCLLLTAILTIVMWFLAPFLCVDVFGRAFRGSVLQLRLLTLGCFGIACLKLLGDALTSQRMPLSEMAAIAIAFVLIIGLDLWLIPGHGGNGAAVGSLLAYTAGGVAAATIFVRRFPARARDLVPRLSDVTWVLSRLHALARR